MVREALAQSEDAAPEAIAAYVERRHGVRIEPRFIPVFTATLEDRERLERCRQQARLLLEQARRAAGA